MNKSVKILFWAILLVFVVASCRPQLTGSKGTSTPTRPAATATADLRTPTPTKIPVINFDEKDLNGVLITYLHPWSAESGHLMDVLVDEFNQTNKWGVHVITREPGSLGLTIQELGKIREGELSVDLAALPVYELLDPKLFVVDLNPYAHSTAFGFSDDEIKDFYPIFWNANLIEGKLYGIPAQQSAAMLFYNSSWAKELGFSTVPLTPAAFTSQVCAANAALKKDNDYLNDGMGGWIINDDSMAMLSWLKGVGSVDLDQPIKEFNLPPTEKTFQYLYNLQKNACAWDGRLPDPYDYFANRQALVYSGTMQDILPQTEAFKRSGLDDQWQALLYPGNSDAALLTEGLSYAVFASDDARQMASWYFIRWLMEPRQQTRLINVSGTLPLTKSIVSQLTDFKAEHPQWAEVVNLMPYAKTLPAHSDAGIVYTVLSDAGSFLMRPELNADTIPELLKTLDATINELKDYQP